MKKLALLAIAAFMALPGLPYTWDPIGPDSINARSLCFDAGLPYSYWVICADNGMYLYNCSTQECELYSYGGLPAVGACHFGPDQVLVAMGNGSWSDGIYRFDLVTHVLEVVFWAPFPNFLEYHEPTGTYWLGTQFWGMYTSDDGLEWTAVPFFEGKSCNSLAVYGEHMVVSELSNLYTIYCSGDNGVTWYPATSSLMISDMAFDGWGKLWGIFPDYSDSSGLWFSDDYGDTWNVSFYGDNMSAVGMDAFGNLFVGWEADVGIAWYDPHAPPPGLTFLNDGLPSLNINKIQLNPSMSAPAIFICTDSGAYCSYDYLVGHVEPAEPASSLHIYPNPARDNLFVTCKHPIQELVITTLEGDRIFCSHESSTELTIPVSRWAEGIYIIQCTTQAGTACRKWVH